MTIDDLILRIAQVLPHPGQIKSLKREGDVAVRFSWRGIDWRVGVTYFVEEVNDGLLVGSPSALLMQALLERGP